jgi:glycosyltransferase involved in cell wall biosynthesis
MLGKLTPGEARGVIGDCELALNPCVLNEWTADALPVKLFDYLAEGKPIVSTAMSELHTFGGLIEVAPEDAFVEAIQHALESDTRQLAAQRREMAARFTLQARARRASELIFESRHEVATKRPA